MENSFDDPACPSNYPVECGHLEGQPQHLICCESCCISEGNCGNNYFDCNKLWLIILIAVGLLLLILAIILIWYFCCHQRRKRGYTEILESRENLAEEIHEEEDDSILAFQDQKLNLTSNSAGLMKVSLLTQK